MCVSLSEKKVLQPPCSAPQSFPLKYANWLSRPLPSGKSEILSWDLPVPLVVPKDKKNFVDVFSSVFTNGT